MKTQQVVFFLNFMGENEFSSSDSVDLTKQFNRLLSENDMGSCENKLKIKKDSVGNRRPLTDTDFSALIIETEVV